MNEVKLYVDEKGHGDFFVSATGQKIATMQIGIHGNELTVYHTEVCESHQGKGLAKKMMLTMVDYARKNNFKVIALCPYVFAQFKGHPKEFSDIWDNH